MAYLGDTSTPKLWKRMKAYINNRIANLEQGITKELLWENASPTSAFAGQTVSLDLSKYDEFSVDFINNLDNDGDSVARTACGFCKRDEYTFVSALAINGFTMRFRRFSAITTNNGIVFSDGYYHNTGATNGANNKNLVPIRIYGIKGVK